MRIDWSILSQLTEVATAVLLLSGAALMLLAALGLFRLPDLLTRMHVLSKAGTVGTASIMLAVALAIPEIGVLTRVIALVAFLVLTAPIASHLLARAAYFLGKPMGDEAVRDDLEGQYDYDEHTLSSGDRES